jgi:uracil-DNA glycosylase family 4
MTDSRNELIETLKSARAYADYLIELGIETVDFGRDTGENLSDKPARAEVSLQQSSARLSEPEGSMLAGLPQTTLFAETFSGPSTGLGVTETLDDIWRDIGDCTRCGLCEGRTQVVNTFGNRQARLMFVGEAPGAEEDAQGKPFVGRAGQLLTRIIEAIGMKRDEVIIGNVNRCRPPGNRQPTLEEAAICRPFLFREIAAVRPEVIVVMGNTALRNLLEIREGITRVRGQFQDFRGIKVMPTFHPAYLLRDPSKKRETWEDMKKVKAYLDSREPGPASN